MKKSIATLTLLCALGALAATTTFFDWPANGTYKPGVGPVKITAIDITGAASNETVIIKRKLPSGATNVLASLTCTLPIEQVAITNAPWIFADDTIERSGTATNARVRVIVQD